MAQAVVKLVSGGARLFALDQDAARRFTEFLTLP
jgi:hypothetical protein